MLVVLGAAGIGVAWTGPASAAVRYVAPNGVTSGPCDAAHPCDIKAVNGLSGTGDEVVLNPGTYTSGCVLFNKGLNVHGPDGRPRPVISAQTNCPLILAFGGTVRHLRIDQRGNAAALFANGGAVVEDVVATSTVTAGVKATAMQTDSSGATVRDSVAYRDAPSGVAFEVSGGDKTVLRNVTIWATQANTIGLWLVYDGFTSPSVAASNIIARNTGGGDGIHLTGKDDSSKARLAINHSNFNSVGSTFGTLVSATANQSAAPTFVDAPPGFHQAASSVTVDAGAPFDVGPADFDGDRRSVGAGEDIGADERTPAPTVVTGAATLVGATVATVTGTVNPNGGATTQYFNWGLSNAYGYPSGLALYFSPVAAGNGTNPLPVSRKLTGLKPSTTYHYRVRAANTAGTSLGDDATLTTGAPGTPDPGGSGPEPGQPGAAILTLTGTSVRPARFRIAQGRTALTARRKPVPRGTTFRFTLSEPATVKIALRRKLAGRRKGTKCLQPTRARRRAKRCTRLVTMGTLTRGAALGANSVRFTGRIGRRKLSPGKYAAVLTASDTAGNRSKARTLAFTILPG
jgi:uncharacterized membrane protein